MSKVDLIKAVAERANKVNARLAASDYREWFAPDDLRDGVYLYGEGGGKRLRPAVLMFACGAVGGDEDNAVSAAAAVEMLHTWTLVHDDVIDNDDQRRGNETVHCRFKRLAMGRDGYDENGAADYGRDLAILSGDVQQSWSVCLMAESALKGRVPAEVVLNLVWLMESEAVNRVICGETMDIQLSVKPFDQLKIEEIIQMLYYKTGALYEFAGKAGAMIGLETCEDNHPQVTAIADFTGNCGIAFQLQDDILGIIGDAEKLGKPIGSDIIEGKRTTLVYYAWQKATPDQRKLMQSVLGNPQATTEEIGRLTDLFVNIGSINETKLLADSYIDRALDALGIMPDSEYKDLLRAWGEYMINRQF